jgi:hypothetical protein
MSVHLLSVEDMRHPEDMRSLVEKGETLSIKLDFDPWILDSARIEIETTIEKWFSSWLEFHLNGSEDLGRAELGDDYDEFLEARDIVLKDFFFKHGPQGLIIGETASFQISPVLLLIDTDRGSLITKKTVVIVLRKFVLGAVGTIGTVLVSHALTQLHSQPPVVVSALVCTSGTMSPFVKSMSLYHKRIENIPPNEIDLKVEPEAKQLLETVAGQYETCTVTVTATVGKKELSTFTLSQNEAAKTLQALNSRKQ